MYPEVKVGQLWVNQTKTLGSYFYLVCERDDDGYAWCRCWKLTEDWENAQVVADGVEVSFSMHERDGIRIHEGDITSNCKLVSEVEA